MRIRHNHNKLSAIPTYMQNIFVCMVSESTRINVPLLFLYCLNLYGFLIHSPCSELFFIVYINIIL